MSQRIPKYCALTAIATLTWAQSPQQLSPPTEPSGGIETRVAPSDSRLPNRVLTTSFRGRELSYVVIDGMAVHAGDIVLGRVDEIEPALIRESSKNRDQDLPTSREVSSREQQYLWPEGIVPFVIDDDVPAEQRQDIQEAIGEWNDKTVISFVARTTEPDYVRFMNVTSGYCRSDVGMVGGEQAISLPPRGCSVSAVVHEIGHALGLWHEHQREDRDAYVSVLSENLDTRRRDAYTAVHPASGPYDYASAMHYSPLSADSANGETFIETIPPGMAIPSAGLSAGDVDGVARLYGKPPETVSISTNPPGLAVVVDGVRVTTPVSFDWADGTTHILEVPVSQEWEGARYLFGCWNDGASRLRNVTVGDDLTWLEANFIVQHRVGTGVEPSGAGSVALIPASPDGFYTVRTLIQAEVTPAREATHRFLRWGGVLRGEHGRASNPARWTVDGSGKEFQAEFTDSPIYEIKSNVDPFVVYIDNYYDVDDYWTYAPTALEVIPGRRVIRLGTDEVRRAVGGGLRRLRFESWSDRGTLSHDVTLPSQGGVITAQITSEYPLSTNPAKPDSGTITVDPATTDAHYQEGSSVVLTAAPMPGWEFVQWQGDIGSRESSTTITMDRPMHVEALFSQAPEVMAGEPESVVLSSTDYRFYPYDEASGFRIEPPSDASEIRIGFEASTPGVEVNLFVKAGSDSLDWGFGEDGRTPIFHADFESVRPGSSESVVINASSDPPLDPSATYFVSFVAFTPGTRIEGTLSVEVERGTSVSVLADTSPQALTFVSPPDTDPPSQVVRLTNRGNSPFRYVLNSDTTWLSVHPPNGTLAAGATAEATVSTLSAGKWPDKHAGKLTVTLSAPSGQNSRALPSIPVAFVVTPGSGNDSTAASPLVDQVLNAASQAAGAAPSSIVDVYGTDLALGDGSADESARNGSAPLPTLLHGASLTVTDSNGKSRLAGLFDVWPTGITFLVPNEASRGAATVIVRRGDVVSDPFSFEVTAVAPGLFSANLDGTGPAWAVAIRVDSTGGQSTAPLADFDASAGSRVSIALNLGPERDQVYLQMFGTGIRGWESELSCTVGGTNVEIYSVSPHPYSPGVDQIILGPLPRDLAGSGEVKVILVADGRSSNSVTLSIE